MESSASVESLVRACLSTEGGLNKAPDAVRSTAEERQQLGTSMLELSMDWKRVLSPMLTFVVAQEALVLAFREVESSPSPLLPSAGSTPRPTSLRVVLTPDRKDVFSELLAHLKALPEGQRSKLPQRHEPWVDLLREQVDLAPGKDAPKRVVHEDELAGMLKLGRQMKAARCRPPH